MIVPLHKLQKSHHFWRKCMLNKNAYNYWKYKRQTTSFRLHLLQRSNRRARKQSNSSDDQQVIHHWPRAEEVIGQPQLTWLALIVPRCNQPQSDPLRATANTSMGPQCTSFTACPSALWRRSRHCRDAQSIAEVKIPLQQRSFSSVL